MPAAFRPRGAQSKLIRQSRRTLHMPIPLRLLIRQARGLRSFKRERIFIEQGSHLRLPSALVLKRLQGQSPYGRELSTDTARGTTASTFSHWTTSTLRARI